MDAIPAQVERVIVAHERAQAVCAAQDHQLVAGPSIPAPPFAPAPLTLTDSTEPCFSAPVGFVGDPPSCGACITNCSLFFSFQPCTFATGAAKVAYAITHLTGKACLWGEAGWERKTPACSSFQAFATKLRKVLGWGQQLGLG